MNPLVILLVGMAIVIGGILLFRAHVFLSLIAAALVVAMLTPASYVFRFSLRAGDAEVRAGADTGAVMIKPKEKLPAGSVMLLLRSAATEAGYVRVGTVRMMGAADKEGFSAAEITWEANAGEAQKVEAGDFAVDPVTEAAARKAMQQTVGERIADGFGRTATEVGILIAMAAILGKTLVESGAAERIVLACRQVFGDERVSLAFLVSGFVLAALVMADTTFYLLIPLAQTMRLRNGKNYTLYILAIVAGATMTHSLVPPAPGPVLIATELHVSLGAMILAGAGVGAVASLAGYLYALWANRRWDIPLRTSLAMDASEADGASAGQSFEVGKLPALWAAVSPVVVPIALIAIRAVLESYADGHVVSAELMRVVKTLGDKNMALAIGAAVGLILLWSRHGSIKLGSRAVVGQGLASAGVVVLIISAGGAFGFALRQTDIAAMLRDMLPASKLALIPLAFLVATAVRTAQGSATVAMITAAGIVGPIAIAGDLGFHPVYLATAIGCGSKPVMWMNDAGFWIIGKTSGFTEGETLKTATVLMTIMGVVGLLATMAGAWLLPMR